jgi:hypothetical protein
MDLTTPSFRAKVASTRVPVSRDTSILTSSPLLHLSETIGIISLLSLISLYDMMSVK